MLRMITSSYPSKWKRKKRSRMSVRAGNEMISAIAKKACGMWGVSHFLARTRAGSKVLIQKDSLSFGFYLNGVHFCNGHPVFFSLDRLGLYAISMIMFMESSVVLAHRVAIHVLLVSQFYVWAVFQKCVRATSRSSIIVANWLGTGYMPQVKTHKEK